MGDCPPQYLKFIPDDDHSDAQFDSEQEAKAVLGNDVQGHMENPNAKWDWFCIGGRWTGFFKVKASPQFPGDIRLGEPGVMTQPGSAGYADQIRKCDVDFLSMRRTAIRDAKQVWAKYTSAVGNLRPPSWKQFREQFADNLDKARTQFHSHPWMLAMQAAQLPVGFTGEPGETWTNEKDFVLRAGQGILSTHAVLHQGEWREQGAMRMFGLVVDKKSPDVWAKDFWTFYNSLSPQTLLTLVDCHI